MRGEFYHHHLGEHEVYISVRLARRYAEDLASLAHRELNEVGDQHLVAARS